MSSEPKRGLFAHLRSFFAWLFRLLFGSSKKQKSAKSRDVSELDFDDDWNTEIDAPLPYRLSDQFLTPAELSFFSVLRNVVGEQAHIAVKVGLKELFRVNADGRSQQKTYRNKIDQKHVDFVLCEPITMRPLVAIELDDKSHRREDRQERDAFVDQVFEVAGLKLLHIPVKAGYSVQDLTSMLLPYLSISPSVQQNVAAQTATTSAPQCPKCGNTMTLRTAKSGSNAGKQFWGCINYPSCRTVIPYQSASPV